jgi:hypothetical protein
MTAVCVTSKLWHRNSSACENTFCQAKVCYVDIGEQCMPHHLKAWLHAQALLEAAVCFVWRWTKSSALRGHDPTRGVFCEESRASSSRSSCNRNVCCLTAGAFITRVTIQYLQSTYIIVGFELDHNTTATSYHTIMMPPRGADINQPHPLDRIPARKCVCYDAVRCHTLLLMCLSRG